MTLWDRSVRKVASIKSNGDCIQRIVSWVALIALRQLWHKNTHNQIRSQAFLVENAKYYGLQSNLDKILLHKPLSGRVVDSEHCLTTWECPTVPDSGPLAGLRTRSHSPTLWGTQTLIAIRELSRNVDTGLGRNSWATNERAMQRRHKTVRRLTFGSIGYGRVGEFKGKQNKPKNYYYIHCIDSEMSELSECAT